MNQIINDSKMVPLIPGTPFFYRRVFYQVKICRYMKGKSMDYLYSEVLIPTSQRSIVSYARVCGKVSDSA